MSKKKTHGAVKGQRLRQQGYTKIPRSSYQIIKTTQGGSQIPKSKIYSQSKSRNSKFTDYGDSKRQSGSGRVSQESIKTKIKLSVEKPPQRPFQSQMGQYNPLPCIDEVLYSSRDVIPERKNWSRQNVRKFARNNGISKTSQLVQSLAAPINSED